MALADTFLYKEVIKMDETNNSNPQKNNFFPQNPDNAQQKIDKNKKNRNDQNKNNNRDNNQDNNRQ